jgi:dihydrofolate reductase
MKSIVVAYDENHVIGRGGELPWAGQLKDDMARFRSLTIGQTVIMGRKTYDSLPERMRPLPRRQSIVVSLGLTASNGFQIARSMDEAYDLATHAINIIGGGQIYDLSLADVDQVHATEIATKVEGGDAFFPVMHSNEWHEIERQDFAADERNKYGYSFVTYLRNHPID